MEKQTLEQELKGFERIESFDKGKYEIWAKGRKRIVYDPIEKEILLKYREREKK